MIRIANAPCSWGVLEFEGECAAAPFTQVLDEMRAAGYDGTELGDWGFMPTEPGQLRQELAARRLQLVGAFVPVALAREEAHAPGVETAVRTARLMAEAGANASFIVLSDENASVPAREQQAGRITRELSLSDPQWTVFAHGATRIAQAVKSATGLKTVFHPHCGGYVEAPWEIDELMARTDPSLVGLLLDTGHILYGGGDPGAVLDAHRSRIWHVHFKDCDADVAERARRGGLGYLAAVREQLFCELGRGAVDFAGVTAALRHAGYTGWIVVEQDVFPGYGTPLDSARRNREYLRGLGL
jgi:inosose dehydratase